MLLRVGTPWDPAVITRGIETVEDVGGVGGDAYGGDGEGGEGEGDEEGEGWEDLALGEVEVGPCHGCGEGSGFRGSQDRGEGNMWWSGYWKYVRNWLFMSLSLLH